MKKHHVITGFIALVVIASVFSFFTPLQFLYAQTVGGLGFGGRIVAITPCNDGLLLKIVGWPPGFFKYQYGLSRQYLMAPPAHPGQWVLGTYLGAVPCMVGPHPVGAGLLITKIGTSI